jgi:hypothetical protein
VYIESGGPLDTLDATSQLRIDIPEASNISVIAGASDDKINIHDPYVPIATPEL